ncbi:hypothetical protein MKW92_038686 [Papaver armeniacum]|nr:hypothetical protein MKW92_038686 [Papaver armeniacum]
MAHNKDDSDLYATIKVVRNEDLYQQIGRDVYCDLVDHDKVRSFRVHNSTPFNLLKETVARQFGVPLQLQRFWVCIKRKNQTCRPSRPLTHEEEKQPVCELKSLTDLIFLEGLELGPDLRTFRLRFKTEEDILLFFNLYDPEKEEIRYVGNLFVKGSAMPEDILIKLNDMANFSPDEEIELYEAARFVPTVMCDLVDQKLTFLANGLKNGDIICFQKAQPVQTKCRYPDIPSFLRYLRYQELQVAKLKVIALKEELKEAEENLSALIGGQHN